MKRFLIHIALLCVACICLFNYNYFSLFAAFDGAYLLQLAKFNFEWCNININLPLNPLQGLCGFNFALNYWVSPAAILSYFLSGDVSSKTFAILFYTFITLGLFSSIWFLAKVLEAGSTICWVASWLGVMFIMPFIVPMGSPWGFFPISELDPHVIQGITLSTITIGLVIKIQFENSAQFYMKLSAILFLVLYSFIIMPGSILISGPFIFIVFVFSLLNQFSVVKPSIYPLLAIGIFSIILFFPFLSILGMYLNTAPALFQSELIPMEGYSQWGRISLLFNGPDHLGWCGTLTYLMGCIGGILAIRGSTNTFKKVALLYVSYSFFLIIIGILLTFLFTWYRGPALLFVEWYIWPLMFIYGAFLITRGGLYLGNWMFLKKYFTKIEEFKLKPFLEIMVPIFLCMLSFYVSKPLQENGFRMPAKSSPFIDILQKEISLIPGNKWNGRVATFNAYEPSGKGFTFKETITYDYHIWQSLGNDHHYVGLWWYNIPSLSIFNQYLTPAYYYVLTRFFTTPLDRQQRDFVFLTIPDTKLLELFGVRFLITCKELEKMKNVKLRSNFDWIQGGANLYKQFLYELGEPNLGNYSPDQQIIVTTAAEAVKKMKDPHFNPQKEVVLTEPIPHLLSTASNVSFIWEKNKMKIRATSLGTSLLILPVEFSHCLQIQSILKEEAQLYPKLIRTNIALTGVLFSGNLDATISPNFGPFTNVLGKMKDYLDMRRIELRSLPQLEISTQ